jgi:hypothetical protein
VLWHNRTLYVLLQIMEKNSHFVQSLVNSIPTPLRCSLLLYISSYHFPGGFLITVLCIFLVSPSVFQMTPNGGYNNSCSFQRNVGQGVDCHDVSTYFTVRQTRGSITPQICVREVPCSNLGRDTGNPDKFSWFPQSLQANAGIVGEPRSGRDSFLPSSRNFIIHPSSYHSIL